MEMMVVSGCSAWGSMVDRMVAGVVKGSWGMAMRLLRSREGRMVVMFMPSMEMDPVEGGRKPRRADMSVLLPL